MSPNIRFISVYDYIDRERPDIPMMSSRAHISGISQAKSARATDRYSPRSGARRMRRTTSFTCHGTSAAPEATFRVLETHEDSSSTSNSNASTQYK